MGLRALLIICFFVALSLKLYPQVGFELIDKKDIAGLKLFLEKDLSRSNFITTKSTDFNGEMIIENFSLLEWAAEQNCQPCFEELLKHQSKFDLLVNLEDEINKSLEHVIIHNNTVFFDYLIEKHPDPDFVCVACHKQCLIQIALNYKNYDAFFKLLEKGAKTDMTNFAGNNLLHSFLGNYDTKDYLIKGIKTPGETVAIAIIDTLLNRKVSLFTPNKEGISAWMYALTSNSKSIYNRVKPAPVSKEIINNKSETAVNSKKENELLFLDKDSLVLTCLMLSCYFGFDEDNTVKNNDLFTDFINDYQIKLNEKLINMESGYSKSLLFEACMAGNENAVKQILNYSPQINDKDKEGFCPLDYAIECGNKTICEVLLEKGAIVNKETFNFAKNTFGKNQELMEKFKKNQK